MSRPRILVVWSQFAPDSFWGGAAGDGSVWLPAILRGEALAEYEATGRLRFHDTDIFLGTLVYFLGPVPEDLGVEMPTPEQLSRVLEAGAEKFEMSSLDYGISAIVPVMSRELGLLMTRRALVAGLRVVPQSPLLKHDFVTMSWRTAELQTADEARATALEILRLYPVGWADALPPDRQDLMRLVMLASLRLAGREAEARRFLESELRPRLSDPRANSVVDALMAMREVDPAAWDLLGEEAGTHIHADCDVLVPFHAAAEALG